MRDEGRPPARTSTHVGLDYDALNDPLREQFSLGVT